MKKILIILFLSGLQIFAQDFEPQQIEFDINGNPNYLISADSALFRQTNMLLGWHWGGGKSMTEALKMNQRHMQSPDNYGNPTQYGHLPASELWDNLDLILCLPVIGWHWSRFMPAQSMSMQYEPTLRISKPDSFITRPNDSYNSIFGFQTVRGYIPTNSQDENYNRLVLTRDSLIGTMVLKEPWMCNQFEYIPPPDGENDDSFWLPEYNSNLDSLYRKDFNGKEMYLSINLRRLDNNIGINIDPVLAISLPYRLKNGTQGKIKFQYIPDTIFTISERGVIASMTNAPTNPDTVYIRRNILPYPGQYDTDDITIYAKFVSDNDIPLNPYFQPGKGSQYSSIDSLKIEVTYLGNCTVAINWLKIECKTAIDLFAGAYDDSLKENAQRALTHYTQTEFLDKNIRPFRFYTVDEKGQPWIWGSYRYLNKLLGNICITEANPIFPKHFNYYVNPSNYLHSIGFNTDGLIVPPYNPKGGIQSPNNVRPHTVLGFKWGYKLYGNADTLKSDWETFFTSGNLPNSLKWLRDTATISEYNSLMGSTDSYQSALERMKYKDFADSNQYFFLYLGKNWWVQNTVGSDWHFTYHDDLNKDTFAVVYRRPDTGEETRAWLWSSLIMGAKGFMMDREYTWPIQPFDYDKDPQRPTSLSDRWTAIGFGQGQGYYERHQLDRLSDWNFLSSESVGSDFLNLTSDSSYLYHYIDTDYIRDSLGLSPNRIYLSRKSLRTEVRKVFEVLRSNDSLLMRLRLACWYGKGFKVFYNQDTSRYGQDTILKNLISLNKDSLFTKKIWNPITNSVQYQKESYDSSFYDITLLRDSSDHGLTSSTFFVGVQNRRTDPLVFWDYGSGRKEMRFLSTAEFEDSCRAVNRDTAKFQSYWWKRLGCREIRIPFKYRQNSSADDYTLLKVTEFGVGDSYLDTVWYRQTKYYHKIDTIIGRDSTLVMRLLPGEGKILKVQVVHTPRFDGFLDYSSQRKIIAYPDTHYNQYLFGGEYVRYHAVYYRPDTTYSINPLPPFDSIMHIHDRVFYKRSLAMNKDFSLSQINWEPWEKKISLKTYYTSQLYDTCYDCRYPAIVRRLDPPFSRAKNYVVYSCHKKGKPIGFAYPIFIVESIFDDSLFINADRGRIIDTIAGFEWGKWGVPVINASSNGNYYAYADSIRGIVTGYKDPDEFYFTSNYRKNIHWYTDTYQSAFAPSLNSYSRIRLGERDAALVWQEQNQGFFRVYYTRLGIINSSLENFIADRFIDTIGGSVALNSDSTILHVTQYEGSVNNYYPVIYRGIEDYPFRDYLPQYLEDSTYLKEHRKDRVYWQSRGGQYTIDFRNIDIIDHDDINTPDTCMVNTLVRVKKSNSDLHHPNATQGTIRNTSRDFRDDSNSGDSVCVVNFIEYHRDSLNLTRLINEKRNAVIWQLHHSYSESQIFDEINISNLTNPKRITGRGIYPNLAALPYVYLNRDWFLGRRIFENGVGVPPKIISSLDYFYRTIDIDLMNHYLLGFKNGDNEFFISSFYLSRGKSQFNKVNLNKRRKNNLDTITSDWFKIGDLDEIRFLTSINNSSIVDFRLQRKRDGRMINIGLQSNPTEIISNRVILVNGRNESYRFIGTRTTRECVPLQMLLLGVSPELFERNDEYDNNRFPRHSSSENLHIIDLYKEVNKEKSLLIDIYPNPADDKVMISTTPLSEDRPMINLTLFTTTGEQLQKMQVKSGGTIGIETQNLSQGVYFIKAESANDISGKFTPILKSFVIGR